MDLRMPDFFLLPNQSQYHSVLLPDTPKIQIYEYSVGQQWKSASFRVGVNSLIIWLAKSNSVRVPPIEGVITLPLAMCQ